jgi:uncharacterized protein (TIGR00730 family)
MPKEKIIYQGEVCLPASELAKYMDIAPEKVSSLRLSQIRQEFEKGFSFLKTYGKAATFFGSARCSLQDPIYQQARDLAFELSKDGFAVITGGGPGIMEAANKGAFEAGGKSAGINIELPNGQRANKYVQESVSFHYFFARKVMLSFASEVYIFFPGGFGTLDEFFEMVTLVQTKKIEQIPIVLVGKEYWTPLLSWIQESLYKKHKTISKEDMEIYRLVDSVQEAVPLIQDLVQGVISNRNKKLS